MIGRLFDKLLGPRHDGGLHYETHPYPKPEQTLRPSRHGWFIADATPAEQNDLSNLDRYDGLH